MAAKSVVIGALCLVFITTVAAQPQDPPPLVCLDTGPLCYPDCSSNPGPGNYQWCGGCKWFIQCVGTNTYYQPCAASTYWDGVSGRCEAVSNTCTECIATTPVEAIGSTTQATPPVLPKCVSTGSSCITDCDVTLNGIYQWCGLCTYFLYCSGSANHFMACQPGLYYDDNTERCEYVSTTCKECDDGTTPPQCNCLNGGVCLGDGTCSCPAGYTGQHCEQVIDYCNPQPCQNGGTCINYIGGFICQCVNGYNGPHCENVNNNCASNPCLNGGTCINQIGSYLCMCPAGWSGLRCQNLDDKCATAPCLNGGTCINGCDLYQCICPSNFIGLNCETSYSACVPNPCLNGGVCTPNANGDPVCTCPPQYTGNLCQSETYDINLTCGSQLFFTGSDPANGFTRLCYFTAATDDISSRSTPCWNTLQGLPIYGDYVNLIAAGGALGCVVSTGFPGDVDIMKQVACRPNYQIQVTLGSDYDYIYVCLQYPY